MKTSKKSTLALLAGLSASAQVSANTFKFDITGKVTLMLPADDGIQAIVLASKKGNPKLAMLPIDENIVVMVKVDKIADSGEYQISQPTVVNTYNGQAFKLKTTGASTELMFQPGKGQVIWIGGLLVDLCISLYSPEFTAETSWKIQINQDNLSFIRSSLVDRMMAMESEEPMTIASLLTSIENGTLLGEHEVIPLTSQTTESESVDTVDAPADVKVA